MKARGRKAYNGSHPPTLHTVSHRQRITYHHPTNRKLSTRPASNNPKEGQVSILRPLNRRITSRLTSRRSSRGSRYDRRHRITLRPIMTTSSHRIARAASASRTDRNKRNSRISRQRHQRSSSQRTPFTRMRTPCSIRHTRTKYLNHFSRTKICLRRHILSLPNMRQRNHTRSQRSRHLNTSKNTSSRSHRTSRRNRRSSRQSKSRSISSLIRSIMSSRILHRPTTSNGRRRRARRGTSHMSSRHTSSRRMRNLMNHIPSLQPSRQRVQRPYLRRVVRYHSPPPHSRTNQQTTSHSPQPSKGAQTPY